MAVKFTQNAEIPHEKFPSSVKHMLYVLSSVDDDCSLIAKNLQWKLDRAKKSRNDLSHSPMMIALDDGGVASVVMIAATCSSFERHSLLRKAVMPLLEERPKAITIVLIGDEVAREKNACAAYYTTLVNAVDLPSFKKEQTPTLLESIEIFGYKAQHTYDYVRARVAGNLLCRQLTLTPPNQLTPALYREKLNAFSQTHGLAITTFDMPRLRSLGAGAFVAVAQGSASDDAAIVKLSYTPPNAKKQIALVGKGICFDTGGHNLKPAKYMQGMHEDMNGSAVALGILQAIVALAWPVRVDCWLAIVQNHIGPNAYKQNDVVTALNGKTIEIVHTDAEGRMVLADTLTLASREKPDLIMDFATLTGSMQTALTNRMSGVFTNRPEYLSQAIAAGNHAGERVLGFPLLAEFDEELESQVADIKQCTLESDGDHLIAAHFLSQFLAHDIPWLHMDLSSYNRKGGLGAVQSDTNGFGVGVGLAFLQGFIAE